MFFANFAFMNLENKLIFATNNANKIAEIKAFVPSELNICTLQDEGIVEDIPEPFETFKENAWAKAIYVFNKTGKPCFAEDSGLVVPALNGAPGVFSARYAGIHGNDVANNAKLLKELQSIENRSAYYTAVICLVMSAEEVYYFEGKCNGRISLEPQGTNGFGYDPLFIPEGYEDTFGILDMDVKKKMSHRSKAVKLLIDHLNKLYITN